MVSSKVQVISTSTKKGATAGGKAPPSSCGTGGAGPGDELIAMEARADGFPCAAHTPDLANDLAGRRYFATGQLYP